MVHKMGERTVRLVEKRNGGLRVEIEPAAAVVLTAWLLTDRSWLCIAALLAAGVHELGHLCAARLLRIPVRKLRLHLLGAGLSLGGAPLSYGAEFLLCAAGPLSSLLLSALLSPLWGYAVCRQLSCASLLLGLFNLLPVRAFDGGRMLSAALSVVCTPEVTDRILSVISGLCLLLLWATAVYFLLRAGDGLSLWCFSMSLLSRFFTSLKREDFRE